MNDITNTNLYTPAKNIWWIEGTTPEIFQQEFDSIYQKALDGKLRGLNKSLAGDIDKEYKVVHSREFLDFIVNTYKSYLSEIRSNTTSKVLDWNDSLFKIEQWINIQTKNESNPVHAHSGLLSYVFWHKVPYTLEEELKLSNNSADYPGDFNFLYCDVDKQFVKNNNFGAYSISNLISHSLKIYKDKENHFAIFPAWLSHYVTKFLSTDEHRVTFSGNLGLPFQGKAKATKSII